MGHSEEGELWTNFTSRPQRNHAEFLQLIMS
jgi:hypothetical protein